MKTKDWRSGPSDLIPLVRFHGKQTDPAWPEAEQRAKIAQTVRAAVASSFPCFQPGSRPHSIRAAFGSLYLEWVLPNESPTAPFASLRGIFPARHWFMNAL
jgi:hypothetical protein